MDPQQKLAPAERIVLRRRVECSALILEPGAELEGRWQEPPAGFAGFAGWDVELDGNFLAIEQGAAERAPITDARTVAPTERRRVRGR